MHGPSRRRHIRAAGPAQPRRGRSISWGPRIAAALRPQRPQRVRIARRFYEAQLGLTRAPVSPPHAVVFATEPIALAVRDLLPDTDLDSGQPGLGVTLWLVVDDAQAMHDRMAEGGVTIVTAPFDGPFGRTFAFRDLDGYVVTIHDAT